MTKKSHRFFVLSFVFLVSSIIFLISSSKALASQTLKAMTFNIGTFFSMPNDQRLQRMNNLGDVITENQFDLVFLQEFNDLTGKTDLEDLLARLQANGWPMYHDAVSYENPDRPAAILLILSKYPLDPSSKQVLYRLGDRTNRSAQSIIVRNTPIGWLRLSNIHTSNLEPCNNLRDLLNFYYQFDKANTLFGGDSNVVLSDKPITNCRGGGWGQIDWNDINISCTNQSQCLNSGIDYFFTAGTSDLYIESQINIGNVRSISDQHPATVAYIGSKNPKFETCQIQGVKKFNNMPEESIRVVVDGNNSLQTTSNPYYQTVGNGNHTVSVTPPTGATVGYTLCYNRSDCHTQTPTAGNSVVINCDQGKYIDLWWHFSKPVITPSPSPSPRPVCENNPDIDRDNDVDIFDYNLLVGNFGKPLTATNKNADIDCNLNIDIFDYNALVMKFGN